MKLTKYEHACFTLEKDGKLLVIDPGSYTTNLGSPENVVAIVVTHDHGDHFSPDTLTAIYNKNPDSLLISLPNIVAKMSDHPSRTVNSGDTISAGPFKLKFSGGQHAVIHDSLPTIENIAVMIDDTVFYPGDSFTIPDDPVTVLALPVAAPWMKISEAIDYFVDVKPKIAFPTHDAILSQTGQSTVDMMVGSFADKTGGIYQRITGSIEI